MTKSEALRSVGLNVYEIVGEDILCTTVLSVEVSGPYISLKVVDPRTNTKFSYDGYSYAYLFLSYQEALIGLKDDIIEDIRDQQEVIEEGKKKLAELQAEYQAVLEKLKPT